MQLDHVSEEEAKGMCRRLTPAGLEEDVLIEILSRFPVKTLFNCKSVCRRWNEIISSPLFVSLHLRNYTNSRSSIASESRIHQFNDGWGSEEKIMHLDPDGDASQILYLALPDCAVAANIESLRSCGMTIKILSGACNGVFLLGADSVPNVFALWNPATGSYRELPAVPPPTRHGSLPPDVGLSTRPVGFGVDTAANDFKVVFIRQFVRYSTDSVRLNSSEFPMQVMVYTHSIGTWKQLEDFGHQAEIRHRTDYRYSSGFGFWLCMSPAAVLVFDFRNEVFRVVNDPVPDLGVPSGNGYCNFVDDRIKKIVLQGDSVALVAQRVGNPPEKFNLWLLNEEQWCWVKQSTVVSLGPREMVVGCRRDGKIEVYDERRSELKLLDPATKAIKTLLERCDEYSVCVFVYKDSLVSVGDEFRRIRVARDRGELLSD